MFLFLRDTQRILVLSQKNYKNHYILVSEAKKVQKELPRGGEELMAAHFFCLFRENSSIEESFLGKLVPRCKT